VGRRRRNRINAARSRVLNFFIEKLRNSVLFQE